MLCDRLFHHMYLTNVKIIACDLTSMTLDGVLVTEMMEDWKKRKG